jgi:integrase/recombinase XerD
MRINECLSLTPADVNLENKEIKVRQGKRNKSRTVAWRNDRTTELLREWLAVRPESEYVFPIVRGPGRGGEASRGNKIPTNSWRGEMKRYVELAGLPSWVSSHNLRHSFSMYMLDRGMLLPELQVLLGHSDMSTTGKYVESHNKQALSRAKSITDSF